LSGKRRLATLAVTCVLALATPAVAAPSSDRILPIDQYTTPKGRRLASTHASALRELNATVYHCIPWVEVQKQSIGFFKPKHLSQDDRYMAIRIYIEQDAAPSFALLEPESRASAMFSRYVGPLLRRMTKSPAVLADDTIDGFTVILEWMKQASPTAGGRPVHETIAVFIDKPTAVDYVAGRSNAEELVKRARVLGWDGETALGQLRLTAWEDNFVSTYKVKNYQLDPGVTCQ
jgi:hypothetical protein